MMLLLFWDQRNQMSGLLSMPLAPTVMSHTTKRLSTKVLEKLQIISSKENVMVAMLVTKRSITSGSLMLTRST